MELFGTKVYGIFNTQRFYHYKDHPLMQEDPYKWKLKASMYQGPGLYYFYNYDKQLVLTLVNENREVHSKEMPACTWRLGSSLKLNCQYFINGIIINKSEFLHQFYKELWKE